MPPSLSPEIHERHEAGLRAFGVLELVVGLVLVGYGVHWASIDRHGPLLGILLVGFGVLTAWTGLGLLRLSPRVRLLATGTAACWLLVTPFGTLLALVLLWMLHGEVGRVVLSDGYAAERRARLQSRP